MMTRIQERHRIEERLDSIERVLDAILLVLKQELRLEKHMQQAFQDLVDEVHNIADVEVAAEATLAALVAKLEAAPDLEAVRAVTAEIKATKDKLAAAIAAVPAEPA